MNLPDKSLKDFLDTDTNRVIENCPQVAAIEYPWCVFELGYYEVLVEHNPFWLAKKQPEYFFENHPEFMASLNPFWISTHKPHWMAEHYPNIMAGLHPGFMGKYYPESMMNKHDIWMVIHHRDWVEEHYPHTLKKLGYLIDESQKLGEAFNTMVATKREEWMNPVLKSYRKEYNN